MGSGLDPALVSVSIQSRQGQNPIGAEMPQFRGDARRRYAWCVLINHDALMRVCDSKNLPPLRSVALGIFASD